MIEFRMEYQHVTAACNALKDRAQFLKFALSDDKQSANFIAYWKRELTEVQEALKILAEAT